jgi:hypothetical protein
MNNLANVYNEQGRHLKAVPLYKSCLETQKRVLGPDHPNTLTSMNNLAAVYANTSRQAEAVPLIESCLEAQKRVLGPDHPETLTSILNLATVNKDQGRHAEAVALNESCLEKMKRVLGPDHPNTLKCMNMYNAQSGHAAPGVGASCTVQGTSRPELNGSKGKVIAFDFNKSRYTVRLPDGRCLALRPANVELLTGGNSVESSTTPVDGSGDSGSGIDSKHMADLMTALRVDKAGLLAELKQLSYEQIPQLVERILAAEDVAAADLAATDVAAANAQPMPCQLPKGIPTDAREAANGQSAVGPAPAAPSCMRGGARAGTGTARGAARRGGRGAACSAHYCCCCCCCCFCCCR